jgi:hypothetical protein
LPFSPDRTADAFLFLVDTLDAEASVVTHAVIRAQSTTMAIMSDLRLLVNRETADERDWADMGLRLMQHRGTLVAALAAVQVCDPNRRIAPVPAAPADWVDAPVPPRPRRRPDGVTAPRPAVAAGVSAVPCESLPEPPRARRFVVAELEPLAVC